MKVKELIELLQKEDPEEGVYVYSEYGTDSVTGLVRTSGYLKDKDIYSEEALFISY